MSKVMKISINCNSNFSKFYRGFTFVALSTLFTLLILWNGFIIYGSIKSLEGSGGGNDFGRFYHSTQAYLNEQGMYGPNSATPAQWFGLYAQDMWDLNPPHFHILFFPLTQLPIKEAFLIWGLLSLAALFASLRLIVKEIAQDITAQQSIIILLFLLMFTGTGLVFRSAQVSFLLLLPLTLAWIKARQNNWPLAGLYLGLGACLKPFLLIFLPYLVFRKQFVALRNLFAVFLVAFSLGLLTFGIEAHKDWIEGLALVNWYWVGSNVSILGFLTRTLGENPTFAVSIDASALIYPFWIVSSLVIALWTIIATASDTTEKAVDRSFALLLIAALLISPLGWTYYLFFSFGPLCSVAIDWWKRNYSSLGIFFKKDNVGRFHSRVHPSDVLCGLVSTQFIRNPFTWINILLVHLLFVDKPHH